MNNTFRWMVVFAALSIATLSAQSPVPKVVFVCEHGSAKSVIAATELERLAKLRGIAITAVSRGTNPDDEIGAAIRQGLKADGIDVGTRKPIKVAAQDLEGATRIITFGPDLSSLLPKNMKAADDWSSTPSTKDFAAARDHIVKQLEGLLNELVVPVSATLKTIILLRHAERQSQDTDSPLSDVGRDRAKELARVLRDVELQRIYTSQLIRTKETAEPIAKQTGLQPEQAATTQLDSLVEKLKNTAPGETVLVIYHSGSVERIVQKLGGGIIPPIHEKESDRIIILTIPAQGNTSVVTLRYGASSQFP